MFGYSCDNCGRGIIRTRMFKNHEVKRGPVRWVVPRAKIGVCDLCGERNYAAKEVKRWEKLRPK